MKRQFLLFGLLMVCSMGFPQFNKIYSTRLNYSWFNCDANKNIYAISEGKFLKFSPPYINSISYELQKEGIPDYVDINNSNEIVLFFENSKKVILLDSLLKELIRPFYLDELGLYEVSMIFSSNDGGLWFYNYFNNSLTKLNKNFIPVVRSLSLNTYFQLPNSPNYIATFEDKIYLNIPSNGILVLGPNGEYRTAFQLPGLIDFQILPKVVCYYRDNIIYCFNFKTLKTKKIYIPFEPDILNAWFHENQIIILNKSGFSVYNHEINPVENN